MDNPNTMKGVQERGNKQTACPVFVGRITLGLALIAVGLLVTGSLFIPNIPFLTVARFAPLILVVLGAEILIGVMRNPGRNVKVGFGLIFLCLILIFGAVTAGVLPGVWEMYGPGRWQEQERMEAQVKRDLYSYVDSTTVRVAYVSLDARENITDIGLEFTEKFPSGEAFAKEAAEVVHVLADMDVGNAAIGGRSEKELYNLSLEGVFSQGKITPERVMEVIQTAVYSDPLPEE